MTSGSYTMQYVQPSKHPDLLVFAVLHYLLLAVLLLPFAPDPQTLEADRSATIPSIVEPTQIIEVPEVAPVSRSLKPSFPKLPMEASLEAESRKES